MNPDDPEIPAGPETHGSLPNPEPVTQEESAPPGPPAAPRVFARAPHRFLVTASGPNDDRFVFDTLRSVLVCIPQKDRTRRLHLYSSEPPSDYRDLAAKALSYLTGAYPAPVPDDAELLQPIEGLPRFLRVLDTQPPQRQEFILATDGPRLYRPHLNEYGQLFNLESILFCCSGWESKIPYDNEMGDIYGWFAWQPPLPHYF